METTFPVSSGVYSSQIFRKGISHALGQVMRLVALVAAKLFDYNDLHAKRLYNMAFCSKGEILQMIRDSDHRESVIQGFVRIAKEGVVRHQHIRIELRKIVQELTAIDKGEMHKLIDEIVQKSLEEDLPKMTEKLFSFLTFSELEAIVKENIAGAKGMDELIDDNALGSEYLKTFASKERGHERVQSLFINFIPSVIELFLKAFAQLDSGKIYSTWEISYMLSVIGRIVLIPWFLIEFLLPLCYDAVTAYLISFIAMVISLSGITAYLRFFRPAPHRIHDNFTYENQQADRYDPITGREEEIIRLFTRIRDQKNAYGRHIMLYGEEGTGKTSLLQAVIKKIVDGEITDPALKELVFYSASTATFEGTATYEGFAAIFSAVMYRLMGYKNVVMILSEFHVANKKNILRDFFLHFLDQIGITIIAVTSKKEFDASLKEDSELLRRFTLLLLESTDKMVTREILKQFLQKKAPDLIVSDEVIESILKHNFEHYPHQQPSRSIGDLEDLINEMHDELNDLKEETQKHVKSVSALVDLLRRFKDHHSGIASSAEGANLKALIKVKMANVEESKKRLDDKKGQIAKLRRVLTQKRELKRAIQAQVKPWKELSESKKAQVKKSVLVAEAYLIRNCSAQIEKKEAEVKPYAELRLDEKRVQAFLRKHRMIWRADQKAPTLSVGKILRVETARPMRLHWTKDDWKNTQETQSQLDPHSGAHFVELPRSELQAGMTLKFTFFWPGENRWEHTPGNFEQVQVV